MDNPDLSNFRYIADTTAVSGRFIALQALEDTVLATETVCRTSPDSMASLPIPKGWTITGLWTTVKLTSGKVLAYIS
jgi:hypothetical protein